MPCSPPSIAADIPAQVRSLTVPLLRQLSLQQLRHRNERLRAIARSFTPAGSLPSASFNCVEANRSAAARSIRVTVCSNHFSEPPRWSAVGSSQKREEWRGDASRLWGSHDPHERHREADRAAEALFPALARERDALADGRVGPLLGFLHRDELARFGVPTLDWVSRSLPIGLTSLAACLPTT